MALPTLRVIFPQLALHVFNGHSTAGLVSEQEFQQMQILAFGEFGTMLQNISQNSLCKENSGQMYTGPK
jgi:hypothetical protein